MDIVLLCKGRPQGTRAKSFPEGDPRERRGLLIQRDQKLPSPSWRSKEVFLISIYFFNFIFNWFWGTLEGILVL